MKAEFDDRIIDVIQEAAGTKKVDVKPGDFTDKPVNLVPRHPVVAILAVASLTGVIDFLNKGIDEKTRDGIFVRVEDPTTVTVEHQVTDLEGRRVVALKAVADVPGQDFGRFVEKENFTIGLQSKFVESPAREDLISKLRSIVAENSVENKDDGVGQSITTRRGARVENATIENPVELAPFRTFPEVAQPLSNFVVRLRDEDGEIAVGLFEADGGAWRNAARLAIKAYLEAAIEDDIPVIA